LALSNLRTYEVDAYLNQPLPATIEPSQEDTNFGDSSGPLFSLYSKITGEEDKKMVEGWQKEADEIIIFVRLEPEGPCLPYHCALTGEL